MTDRDDLLEKLSRFRDQQFATLVTMIIGLACEQHPEEMRNALSRVFDIQPIKDQYEGMHRQLMMLRQDIEAAREELRIIKDEMRKTPKSPHPLNGHRR